MSTTLDCYSTRGASAGAPAAKVDAAKPHPLSYGADLPRAHTLIRFKKGEKMPYPTPALLRLTPAERKMLDARPLQVTQADEPMSTDTDTDDGGRLACYSTRGCSDGPARTYKKRDTDVYAGVRSLDQLVAPTKADKAAWAARPITVRLWETEDAFKRDTERARVMKYKGVMGMTVVTLTAAELQAERERVAAATLTPQQNALRELAELCA